MRCRRWLRTVLSACLFVVDAIFHAVLFVASFTSLSSHLVETEIKDFCNYEYVAKVWTQNCSKFSSEISWRVNLGELGILFSLAGAKKFLKMIDGNAGAHVDQLLKKRVSPMGRSRLLLSTPNCLA